MLKRDFLKIFSTSVSLFSSYGIAMEAEEDGQEDVLVFNGTGIIEVPTKNETVKKVIKKTISRPLWIRRDDQSFQIDVATINGYKAAQWVLRDKQAGRMGFPDVKLLNTLSISQVALASLNIHSRFDITSGMRIRETNNKTEGAALASLHIPDKEGRFFATDFRAKGFDAKFTARLMSMAGMGGIGLYLSRDFVHTDTGRIRRWVGS
jgi:uncharacterized protein YcbK (DUF882 family)